MIGSHPILTLPLGLGNFESCVWVGKEVWGLKALSASGFVCGLQTAPDASVSLLLPSSVDSKVQFGQIHCELFKNYLEISRRARGSVLPQFQRPLYVHPPVVLLYGEPECLISHFLPPSTR